MTNTIFSGNSKQSSFAALLYKRLISREWVGYADVMAEFMGMESVEELPCNVLDCDYYGELKKAFRLVRKAMIEKAGGDCFECRGTKTRKYRYIGEMDNPLAGEYSAVVRKNVADYYEFCQASAGFFPSVWVEHFFAQTMDFSEIVRKKKHKEQIIGSSADRRQKNIEWLPFFYECIRDRKVLQIEYRERYQVSVLIEFHPHYLKEFNGRWYLYGHADEREPREGYSIPLDRIERKPKILPYLDYESPSIVKYPDFFDDIIGTTHVEGAAMQEIELRIHDEYMFGLVESKPFHHSQQTLHPYDSTKGYGEICLRLRPNNEFFGRILQLGADLEIVQPAELREEMAQRIENMYARYAK